MTYFLEQIKIIVGSRLCKYCSIKKLLGKNKKIRIGNDNSKLEYLSDLILLFFRSSKNLYFFLNSHFFSNSHFEYLPLYTQIKYQLCYYENAGSSQNEKKNVQKTCFYWTPHVRTHDIHLPCVQEVVTPIYIVTHYINWGNYFLDTQYI